MKKITNLKIKKFKKHLENQNKAKSTIDCYVRYVSDFRDWLDERSVTKKCTSEYVDLLLDKYVSTSVNMIISALNAFFDYNAWPENKISKVKTQGKATDEHDKELTEDAYRQLLDISKNIKNQKLYLILRIICATGVRASELVLITVESVKQKRFFVEFRGNVKAVSIPDDLCKLLLEYIDANGIEDGSVFVDDKGKPLNRYDVYCEIKKLCEYTDISDEKITPASIRHLPKRTYTDQMVRLLTY